ncbi:hypothetical protein H6G76_07885 [Nostoc sp. FACHB-152]|uniref:hypothetical protein n=1 Tax=unclassified Nostoc TaxID=2593658 RepID=UPI001689424C|nr:MULTISPECIES: hypothetical protein [unclassified Nostoc]MBD2447086.1 hypothetical protein [Nostoc sp. FACHB-152]MBD2472481.1 hypothetical protein [Nostoc sp. FACHB-145]
MLSNANQKKIQEINNIYYVSRSEIKQEKTQPQGLNTHEIALNLSPIALLSSWIIFFLVLRKVRTFLDNKMVFTVKTVHQVPCKNCRFYSNNHYLKCAVQPSIVMTDEAKNCSEYSPKNEKLTGKQFFKQRD